MGLYIILKQIEGTYFSALVPLQATAHQYRVFCNISGKPVQDLEMRGFQISFSKTQKLRLESSLEQLESISSKANSKATVTVADTIPVNYEDGVLKGHGTADTEGRLVATVCGVVERVNKLVYVRALRARYKPEIGDIIVGRVIEVAPKRWNLEINFSQDAVLMLSSMNLPDGMLLQRRRTAVDELNMRSIFQENNVICAEVRGFQHDGCLHLQARSQKYGKLHRGQLLQIPPYLVKRRKQHFYHLDQFGVDLIIGCNGFIWVGDHVEPKDDMVVDQVNKSEEQSANSTAPMVIDDLEERGTSVEIRQYICRAANALRVLSTLGFMVTMEVVMELVDLSTRQNLDAHEMLGAEFIVQVAEQEVDRSKGIHEKEMKKNVLRFPIVWISAREQMETNRESSVEVLYHPPPIPLL